MNRPQVSSKPQRLGVIDTIGRLPSDTQPRTRPVLVSLPTVGPRAESLGKAHYSYGFAAEAFQRMFTQMNVDVRPIEAPEQFKSAGYASTNDFAEGRHLHLIFRSTEQIRPIVGAHNIACFAWEFDALKHDGLPTESILHDQVAMLATCDEIWTPCSYTKAILAGYGLEQVHVIPAPIGIPEPEAGPRHAHLRSIELLESVPLVTRSSAGQEDFVQMAERHSAPLRAQPRLQRAIRDGQVFLTVCNPYDSRKNLAALIEGFLMATQDRHDCVLVVKLVTSGQFGSPAGYLYHQMRVLFGNPHCLHEESVVLFSGFLTNEEMAALYNSADYYVSASIGEGQNLPLLEAMAHGCVPVSVANTAMADYISDNNAVVIADRRFRGMVSGTAGDVAGVRLTVPFADRFDVARAVTAALGLNDDEKDAKRQNARASVARLFSPEAVFEAVTARARSIMPDADIW